MKYNDLQIQDKIFQSFQKDCGLIASSIEFISVGEESYAYIISTDRGDKYFVKYCEQPDITKNIDKVNNLLLQLMPFPFVVPPIEIKNQTSFDVIKGKMYVYPYIKGEVVKMENEKFDKKLVKELTKIMAFIHNSKPSLDLPKEQFKNDFTERLEKLLVSANKGEFEDSAKQLLLDDQRTIRDVIEKHTVIAKKYLAIKPELVLTHGDITGLNLIMSSDGVKLVDWDGAMFAPAERDINFLFDNPNFSINEYLKLTGKPCFNAELGEYYCQDWSLDSIIGNFESILNHGKAKGNVSEYVEEINEYLKHYK